MPDAPLELFHRDAQGCFSSCVSLPACIPHYFFLPGVEALGTVLRRDGRLFIEMGRHHTLSRDLEQLQDGRPDFGLCLSTRSAYHCRISALITRALNDRFGLSRLKTMQIMTCLQEALTNAVIHGNLRIACARDTPEGFERYFRLVEQAAASDAGEDRVYVRAWDHRAFFRICVTHEGKGRLDPALIAHSRLQLDRKNGRGLFIIQSLAEQVTTDDACRSIDITFTY